MPFVLAALSLLSGSSKAVSVCGVNAALSARPRSRAGRVAIALYLAGLLLGASLLTITVATAGQLLAARLGIASGSRVLAASAILLTLGVVEVVFGASLLPQIRWAVPRSWAIGRSEPFLLLFGLIRGVAIFNHSPFASMHAWLVVVFLLPELAPWPMVAVAFALGLSLWSVALAMPSLLPVLASAGRVEGLAWRSLAATETVARADGAVLIVLGGLLLLRLLV